MMIEWKKQLERYKWLRPALVWGTVILCTVIMVSLCFNEAVDYDEAYGLTTVRGNTLRGIWDKVLADYDTDIPFWYWMARVWTYLFGESIFSFKIFSVAGTVCTMILGATVVFRKWGARAAVLFIIPLSLAPGFLHYNIYIRMYPWMTFFVVACALLSYFLVEKPDKWQYWLLLFALTAMALMSHQMTAFHFLFIYGYLLLELAVYHRKQIWKVFVCGVSSLIPMGGWILISGFLHFMDTSGQEHSFGFHKVNWGDAMYFLFRTELYKAETYVYALALLGIAAAALLLLRRRFPGKGEWSFLVFSLLSYFGSYFLAAAISSVSTHFFTPRHVMMGGALMWLAIAVVLSKVNMGVWLSAMAVTAFMCSSSYEIEYRWEYETTPYLKETQEMIAEEMKAGDIVIYNAMKMFGTVYKCYMPEQNLITLAEVDGAWLQEHAGDRVWFFYARGEEFPQEYLSTYHITMEGIGHYGFQIIEGYTDFDVFRMTIGGAD